MYDVYRYLYTIHKFKNTQFFNKILVYVTKVLYVYKKNNGFKSKFKTM